MPKRARPSDEDAAATSSAHVKHARQGVGGGIVVSESPMILLFEAFATPQEVAALLRMAKVVHAGSEFDMSHPSFEWSPADRALIEDLEKRLGEITGCAPHAEEMPLLIMRSARSEEGEAKAAERFPSKLHVDVNGGLPRRFASALLYLSTPRDGGQTVFPLALTDASAGAPLSPPEHQRAAGLAASRRLLKARLYHTGSSKRPEARELEALISRAPTVHTPPIDAAYSSTADGVGVAIRARAGNLLVFWTRDAAGIDAASWHAGERVAHGAVEDKWLLRKFKEVPKAIFDDPDALATFVGSSRMPTRGAKQ